MGEDSIFPEEKNKSSWEPELVFLKFIVNFKRRYFFNFCLHKE